MSKFGRAPFFAIVFYIALGTFITWQEYYTPITSEDFRNVVLFRLPLFATALAAGFYLRKNPFSLWANAFISFNFLIYSMVGHYYHPLYYACFMQTLIAFSILFYTTRLQHFVLMTIKTIMFISFYLATYDLVK